MCDTDGEKSAFNANFPCRFPAIRELATGDEFAADGFLRQFRLISSAFRARGCPRARRPAPSRRRNESPMYSRPFRSSILRDIGDGGTYGRDPRCAVPSNFEIAAVRRWARDEVLVIDQRRSREVEEERKAIGSPSTSCRTRTRSIHPRILCCSEIRLV